MFEKRWSRVYFPSRRWEWGVGMRLWPQVKTRPWARKIPGQLCSAGASHWALWCWVPSFLATASLVLSVGESQGLSSQLDTWSSVCPGWESSTFVLGIHLHRTVSQKDPARVDLDWSGSRLSSPLSGPPSIWAVTWEMILFPSIPGWSHWVTNKRPGISNSSLHHFVLRVITMVTWLASVQAPCYRLQLLPPAWGPEAADEPGDHRQPAPGIQVLPCSSTCPSVRHHQDLEAATKLRSIHSLLCFIDGRSWFLHVLRHSSSFITPSEIHSYIDFGHFFFYYQCLYINLF